MKITIEKIKYQLDDKTRKIINARNQKKLKNKDLSLISSNCNGAFILHDLGMRFNSPFVNLWMKPKDYLKMLNNLKYYMSLDPVEVFEDDIDYPVGELDDIRVYFMHFLSFDEARQKWNERKERLQYDNLFILFNDKGDCTIEDLLFFDSLPYKHKAVFTHIPYSDIKSSVYIRGFESEKEVGDCYRYRPDSIGKKYYDDFDYVSWFNNK